LFFFGLDSFLNSIIEAARSSIEGGTHNADTEKFSYPFSSLGIYIASSLVFFLGYLAMLIGITYVSCTSLDGKRISLAKAFEKIFSKTFLRSIGQILLLSLAFIGFMFVAIMIIVIAGIIDSTILKFFGGIAVFAAMLFILFFSIRWYFAFVAIVREDVNPVRSFGISNFLVKGYWWRTFGLILLTSITAQFAVSIITTPLSFIIMWDFFAEYFKLFAGGTFNQNDPSTILELMKSIGVSFGFVIVLSTILQSLITPLFNIVMYYDLKIRGNEFDDELNDTSISPAEEPTIE